MKLTGQIEGMQTGNNRKRLEAPGENSLHPAWLAFIRYCRELGYGEISNLKVQDGIPVMAEETIKKVKFV